MRGCVKFIVTDYSTSGCGRVIRRICYNLHPRELQVPHDTTPLMNSFVNTTVIIGLLQCNATAVVMNN